MLAPPVPCSIRISPAPFGDGYDVEIILPLDTGNFDQNFPGHKQARGYGVGLGMSLGLPLVDLCGETNG